MINAVNEFLDDLRGGRMAESPIVQVEQGQLQGKLASTPSGRMYFSFQGIPYAKPPLGSLRFKDPQPHENWEGIRDATAEGNIAPQIDVIFDNPGYRGDENCLYLNVYTPNLDGSFLPVMFYIHGGGLTSGSGSTDMYGPDFLVEKDVVLVTINYRLGALGFLCLNTPEVPGNAGLKDCIMALRWVKENIHNFGGNPGNVTIFGESAGAAITTWLTASPLSRNLFNRAIVESGTALMPALEQRHPIENARKLAESLGCDSESVEDIYEFLSATPAKDIVEAITKAINYEELVEAPKFYFGFVSEKEFPGVDAAITEPFLDMLTSGRLAKVPIMVGTTTLETGFPMKSDDLQYFIPHEFNIEKNSETALAIAEDLRKLYFKGGSEEIEYAQLMSDKMFNVDNHRYIQCLIKTTNVPVYFYKFDYVGSLNIKNKLVSVNIKGKAMHLDELGYLFKNKYQDDVESTPQDLEVRERMVRLWTNFAKTGNPTPDENHYITVTWPPVSQDNEYYLLIGQELTVGINFDKEKMDFWDELYNKHFKTWNQPRPNSVEPRNEPVIIETLTVVSSNEGSVKEVIETVTVTSERFVESVVESLTEENSTNLVESEPEVAAPASASETVEKVTEVVEKVPEVVDKVPEVVEKVPEVVEKVPEVVEKVPEVVEKAAEVVRKSPAMIEVCEVDAPRTADLISSFEAKPHLNGNSNNVEKKSVRTSNEIKMVQSANGMPKDVIRANDPPEDDLPKNIGVNKFVNFFESLGGKK